MGWLKTAQRLSDTIAGGTPEQRKKRAEQNKAKGSGGWNDRVGCRDFWVGRDWVQRLVFLALGLFAVIVLCMAIWQLMLLMARTWYYWLGPLLVIIGVIVFLLLKLKKQPSYERKRGAKIFLDASFIGCLILPVVGMLVASIYFFATRHTEGHLLAGICALIAAVFLSVVAIIEKGKYKHDIRQQDAKGELDKHIQTALRKMQSVGRYYTDEDNANQQLCLLLRELMPGVDIRLMPPGSTGGDIRVANTIIEGKLDLENRSGCHTLVGQLQDYCSNTPYQIRVVVYGKLRPEFRRRIENLPQCPDRILLHHIEGTRTRKPTGKRYTVIEQTDDDYDEETNE